MCARVRQQRVSADSLLPQLVLNPSTQVNKYSVLSTNDSRSIFQTSHKSAANANSAQHAQFCRLYALASHRSLPGCAVCKMPSPKFCSPNTFVAVLLLSCAGVLHPRAVQPADKQGHQGKCCSTRAHLDTTHPSYVSQGRFRAALLSLCGMMPPWPRQ